MKTLQQYLDELQNIHSFTGLKLSASGRFIGFNPDFISWFNALGGTMEKSPNGARRKLQEAYMLITEKDAEAFPRICELIKGAIHDTIDSPVLIDAKTYDDFLEACSNNNVPATETIKFLMRDYIDGYIAIKPDRYEDEN